MHRKHSVVVSGCGWGLVEALVVLAILALAITLAWPPFVEQQRRAHRLEAMAMLEEIRLAQERYRATHHGYAVGLAQLGRAADEVGAARGRYRVRLEAVATPALAFRAVAWPATDQAQDRCGPLVLTERGPERDASGAPDCWPR